VSADARVGCSALPTGLAARADTRADVVSSK